MNNSYKSILIESGIYNEYMLYAKAQSCYFMTIEYGYKFPDKLVPYFNSDFTSIFSMDDFKLCRNIYDSYRQRVYRLKKKISKMLESSCLFLTLTFTNEYLLSTSESERRKAIIDYLSQFGVPCIANIDFGKINEREHYHAILQIDSIDYHSYTFGDINGKRVRNNDLSSQDRISAYISKLTNHAIKETTKGRRIIYLNMR